MIDVLGLKIHIYGLLIGVAIYVVWEITSKIARVKKVPDGHIDRLAWWVIGFGLLGARIYHVIDYWQRYYFLQPFKIFYVWEGGLGIWGAVIGGLVGLLVYRIISRMSNNITRVNYLIVLDSITTGLPLGQAIGRVGNWVNGELYGKNGEPLFFYEAILNLFLFSLLWIMSKRETRNGFAFGAYLCGYGLIRLLLENYRKDSDIWKVASLPVASMVSILAIMVGIYFLSRKRVT